MKLSKILFFSLLVCSCNQGGTVQYEVSSETEHHAADACEAAADKNSSPSNTTGTNPCDANTTANTNK